MTPRDRPEPLPSLKVLQRELEDDGITGRAVHLARAARASSDVSTELLRLQTRAVAKEKRPPPGPEIAA